MTWYVQAPRVSREDLVEDTRATLLALGWTETSPEPSVGVSDVELLHFSKRMGDRVVRFRGRPPFEPSKSTLDLSVDAQDGSGCNW